MDWNKGVSSSPAKKKMLKWVARKMSHERQVTYILIKVERDGVLQK